MMDTFGITVRLRTSRCCDAVRDVLERIQQSCPEDFVRLQKNVREIVPYEEDDADTCGGEWREDLATDDDPSTWGSRGKLPGVGSASCPQSFRARP